MGNLYTHTSQRHDKHIAVRAALKAAWHHDPRDFKQIKLLQHRLKKLETPPPPTLSRTHSLQQKYGLFAYKHVGDLH